MNERLRNFCQDSTPVKFIHAIKDIKTMKRETKKKGDEKK